VEKKDRLVAILGPTATGKSSLGIKLAQRFSGEIISGDSMLVYKGMDIGTAKPSKKELGTVVHHMVDILEPDADFSVAEFKTRAEDLIRDINQRGRLPFLVGGTGLYARALLEDYDFAGTSSSDKLRDDLAKFCEEKGPEALHALLAAKDPETAARLHPNDVKRVTRALETSILGRKISSAVKGGARYDAVVFGLKVERSLLYDRINKRVDRMIEDGLEEEVKDLLERGVTSSCLSMKSLGYRQMAAYLNGEMEYGKMVDEIKQKTRNFAKRQMTWYKKMPYIIWFDADTTEDLTRAEDGMADILVQRWKN